METIGSQTFFSYSVGDSRPTQRKNTELRKLDSHRVNSYLELATKIAELQYVNRHLVLLFRGQSEDHRNRKKNTTLRPSILRPDSSNRLSKKTVIERFKDLKRAESHLVKFFPKDESIGIGRLKRNQIIRWSILQHYEVCPTPLLDVTHSLRIAASFATDNADNLAYILVLGVPNLGGAITASVESGLQIIRLSSVCPPIALRPHIQEGYLLGEYPEMDGYEQKELFANYEMDFGRRLVAKFSFDPKNFRENDGPFPKVNYEARYPNSNLDPFCEIAEKIKMQLNQSN
jgi:hypothetical protein